METTVYLLRHAQARPLPTVPEPEWRLSDCGEAQARALVPIIEALGIDAVYTSPFRRSRDTLQPFGEAAGLEVTVNEGLRERCLSDRWIGDFRDVWRQSWADLSFTLEGGESSLACRSRMVRAVHDVVDRHRNGTVVLGSHGYSIALLLTTLDPAFGVAEASALRTPELIRLYWRDRALEWDRGFAPGPAFDRLATDFRLTPGIVA